MLMAEVCYSYDRLLKLDRRKKTNKRLQNSFYSVVLLNTTGWG